MACHRTGSPPLLLLVQKSHANQYLPHFPSQRRMKAIMTTCFQSVRHKLSHRIGYFDLLGFDFMLDSHLNVSQ